MKTLIAVFIIMSCLMFTKPVSAIEFGEPMTRAEYHSMLWKYARQHWRNPMQQWIYIKSHLEIYDLNNPSPPVSREVLF